MTTPTPPPAAATLHDAELLTAYWRNGITFALTDGQAGLDEVTGRADALKAELLRRLSARPEPGMVCISREEARSIHRLTLRMCFESQFASSWPEWAHAAEVLDAALATEGPGA